MKKIKLKLSSSQINALLLIVNTAGISIIVEDIEEMALKEQYTRLFLKLQLRSLTAKTEKNSLKLSITECWAIDTLLQFDCFEGFELNTIKYLCREIDKQIVSL